MCSLVLTAREGPVTTATLNRPLKRNALNIGLLEELCAALDTAEHDPSQRIFVLRGAGALFCSGLDLFEVADPGVAAASTELMRRALLGLGNTRLVTVAVVQGAAIAGGAGLMTACDFAIATPDAKFGFPEIRRGLVPALIMTFLRRQLRERDARELLLLGNVIDADRARAIGLVNRIAAEPGDLETELHAIVEGILHGAPEATAETKKQFAELWPVRLSGDLERAQAHHVSARGSAEAREGLAAFREKRLPRWAQK